MTFTGNFGQISRGGVAFLADPNVGRRARNRNSEYAASIHQRGIRHGGREAEIGHRGAASGAGWNALHFILGLYCSMNGGMKRIPPSLVKQLRVSKYPLTQIILSVTHCCMPPCLPSSPLADRFAGLSGDVGRKAEEAWLLKRMVLEWLAQILAMLAGLAAQFAAGTLPQPQAARPAPVAPPRLGLKAAGARRSGCARGGADDIQDEVATEVFALGTYAPSQTAPATTRASGSNGPSRGDSPARHSLRLDRGTLRRNG